MEELGRIGADAYKAMAKKRIRVILDDVRSRHNVGAIFRTADAFALEGIVLCGFTPVPPHREIEKTALGATLSVPWSQATSATAAIQALRSEGFRIVAVEQTHGAIALADWQPSSGESVALVFGNELNGGFRRSDRPVRRMHHDTPVWHQALAEHRGVRWYRALVGGRKTPMRHAPGSNLRVINGS